MCAKKIKKKFASKELFLSRELSWLDFNQRVLEEASDRQVPLLERLKFLAITASNLDEFFMVRVGGLQLLKAQGRTSRGISGLTPRRQLERISRYARKMVKDQYACFEQDIEPALYQAKIRAVPIGKLDANQWSHVKRTFEELVYPVITPMAIHPDGPFPLLKARTVYVAVTLPPVVTPETATEPEPAPRLAVVEVPRNLARFMTLPGTDGYAYVHLEEILVGFMDRIFPGETVVEAVPFRITRNADMQVRESEAPDLLSGMEDILEARRTSPCVRLEIGHRVSSQLLATLRDALEVESEFLFRIPGPLDLSAYMGLAGMSGFDEYKSDPWPPQIAPELRPPESMFEILSRRDVLLCHPFDSFDPVVRLLEEAAEDPDVLAIKQILYRTSARSPVVAALARAAENGKQVTALVELKARFDEARNIEWARALETAGVQVIYGVRGFKTHAKVCIIIRRESVGIRRYTHFGTGNYNENTARLYTDISYMTANEDYGADAATFFNTISGYGKPAPYRKIEAAPIGLRDRLLEGIEGEIARKRQGQKAHIMAKFNSLVDPVLIEALYRASQEGVKVDLNVRGICCLRPGVKGLSEKITVVSIVDRLLEHSRIIYFRRGGEPVVYISSADWMPRNLDRRIELLVPVETPALRHQLEHILKTCLKDNVKGRELGADGVYRHRKTPRSRPVHSQSLFYQEACAAVQAGEAVLRREFKPHRPPEQ